MNSAIANLINQVDDITDIYYMLSQKHKDKLVNVILEDNRKKINNLKKKYEVVEMEKEDEEDEEEIVFYWNKQEEEEKVEVEVEVEEKDEIKISAPVVAPVVAPVLYKCEQCGSKIMSNTKTTIARHNKSKKHLRAVAIANGKTYPVSGEWLRNSLLGKYFTRKKIDADEVYEISFYDFSFDKKYKTPKAWEGRVWFGCEALSNFTMFNLYNTSSPFAMELSNFEWDDEE